MASLALGVAGAAVGSMFGNPGVGYMVGSALGAALFPPKGQDGPRLTDLKVQNSTYGAMIPIVYNDDRVAGTVIWSAQKVEHANQQDSGSGGGGSTSYTYTCSFAVSVCRGPKAVTQIWANGKMIYDFTTGGSNVKFTSLVQYHGTEDQLPDPTIEADKGVGNVPAYRDHCYVVFTDLELGKFGNALPNLTFKVTAIPSIPDVFESVDPITADLGGPYTIPDSGSQYELGTLYVPSTNKLWKFTNPTYAKYRKFPTGSFAILDPNSTTGEFTVSGYTSSENGIFKSAALASSGTPPANQSAFDSAVGATSTYHENEYLIVPTGSSGAWAGKDGQLAKMVSGVWSFITPTDGMKTVDYAGSWDVWVYTLSTNSWNSAYTGHDYDYFYNFLPTWMEYSPATDCVYVCSPSYGEMRVYSASTGICTHQYIWPQVVWDTSYTVPYCPANGDCYSLDDDGHIWMVGSDNKASPKLTKVSRTDGQTILEEYAMSGTNSFASAKAVGNHVFYVYTFGSTANLNAFDKTTHTFSLLISAAHGVSQSFVTYRPTGTLLYWFYQDASTSALNLAMVNASTLSVLSSPAYPSGSFGSWTYDSINDVMWQVSFTGSGSTSTTQITEYNPTTFAQIKQSPIFYTSNSTMSTDSILTTMGTQVAYPDPYSSAGFYRYQSGSGTSDGVKNLAQILTDISLMTNSLTSDQLNFGQLADIVPLGYCLSSLMTGRAAIEPLATAFFFDIVDSDGKLKAVKRGGAPVATVNSSKVMLDGNSNGKFNLTRQQESELPILLTHNFINVNTDFQQGSQQARRQAPKSQQKVSVNSPIVFTDDMGRTIADKLLYNVWVERDRFAFSIPREFAYLEPTDVVTLVDDDNGLNFLVRVVNADSDRTGTMQLEAVTASTTIYNQNPASATASVVPQTYPVSSITEAILFEIPPLRSADVSAGFYLAMCGQTAVWAGGLLYQSLDGGANYLPYAGGQPAATMGSATTKLNSTSNWSTSGDTTNTVTVQLFGGTTLSSATDAAISAGVNLAALECNGGWELFQFKTATLVSADTYTLSNLTRGVRNTRWAAPEHAIGNRFVLIDQTSLQRCNLPDSLLQSLINYKVLTNGQNVGSGTVVTFNCTGEDLKYPSNADVSAQGTGGDITLRVSPTLDTFEYLRSVTPETRTYEVEFWDSTFTTLKRLVQGLTPGFYAPTSPYDFQLIYTAAQQTADFGSAQTSVYVKVYGVHPVLGRNHSPKLTVPVTGSGGIGGGGSGTGGGGGSGTRDPLQQPFASTSIWNMPIGSSATYVAAGIDNYPESNQYAYMPGADSEHIILVPTAPLTDIRYSSVGWSGGDRCVTGGATLTSVPIPTSLVIANSNKNEGAAILRADGHTIAQAQPIARCTAGSYATAMVTAADVDLYGDGIAGCHGGSGLSSIGGCIRVGELRPGATTGPKHALKVNVYAKQALFEATTHADGFRWPATTCDSYAVGWYGTSPANSNTAMKQGSLLAIPASVDITTLGLVTEPAKQLAWTLQNYGAYIVDDTYAPGFDFSIEEGPGGSKSAEFQADYGYAFAQRIGLPGSRTAWVNDIMILVSNLYVVNNNTSSTIGGGGTPLQPLAPTIP